MSGVQCPFAIRMNNISLKCIILLLYVCYAHDSLVTIARHKSAHHPLELNCRTESVLSRGVRTAQHACNMRAHCVRNLAQNAVVGQPSAVV